MHALARWRPDVFSLNVLEELRSIEERMMLQQAVQREAYARTPFDGISRRAGITLRRSPGELIRDSAVAIMPSMTVVFLLVGIAGIALSRVLENSDWRGVGRIGQAAALFMALAVTVALVGLAPAKYVPMKIQAWVLTALLTGLPTAVGTWIGWRWLRRRGFKFTLRTMLIATTVLAIPLGFVTVVGRETSFSRIIPIALSIPTCRWAGLDVSAREDDVGAAASWIWVAGQWIAWGGQYLTLGLWAI